MPLHVQYSPNGSALITVCNDQAKLWKYKNSFIVETHSVKTTEPVDLNHHPLACISDNFSVVIVYRGKFTFTVYDCSGSEAQKKDEIDLVKEVSANGNPGFSVSQADRVTDMRLVENDNILRIDFCKNKENFIIDVQLSDSVAKMRKVKNFEDRSAFTLEAGTGVSNIKEK